MTMMTESYLLPILVLLPSLAALLLIFFKGRGRTLSLLAESLALATLLCLWWRFDHTLQSMQFNFSLPWIPRIGASLSFGIDQLSLALTTLSTLTFLVVDLYFRDDYEGKSNLYRALFLLVQTCLYITFLSTDLLLFYMGWELALVPIFFMILIFGGERRKLVAMTLFFYTIIGSLFMLLALIALSVEAKSTSYATILAQSGAHVASFGRIFLFLAVTLAFLIKIPVAPFHGWQPLVYSETPKRGAVILAALLSKMGMYGLLRFSIPLFPDVVRDFAPYITALAIFSIIYGAITALGTNNIIKFIAYSSISHSGAIVAGLFSLTLIGISGAVYQMFNHGVLVVGLFFIAYHLQTVFNSKQLSDYQCGNASLARYMPLTATYLFLIILSSIALPGTNSFVGEFAILLGIFENSTTHALFAGTTIIVGAVYALVWYQRLIFHSNQSSLRTRAGVDLDRTQIALLTLLVLLIFSIGFFPELTLYKFKVLFFKQ
ncbi:MAG: NADH-quinone oxidoreductase subunit M [Oligoflexia bacterium]|nr:NADH-quinone oxidoreductase subunit M [Oligoflexia bacterium]MBF0364096.1 NADH-quinone oxidoreductase subunit M [Oligoflexia bacterium]